MHTKEIFLADIYVYDERIDGNMHGPNISIDALIENKIWIVYIKSKSGNAFPNGTEIEVEFSFHECDHPRVKRGDEIVLYVGSKVFGKLMVKS